MHSSVQSGFRAFNEPFEGSIAFMYLDIKGLVTVGVGNLIDPVELATKLPFRFKTTGTPASTDQIAAEWSKLKNNPSLVVKGHKACEPITELQLNDDAIDALIAERLAGNESFLKRKPAFAAFDTWPADAQMALLSMAWAMGPGAFEGFPRFSASCQKGDFKAAALECKMNEQGNPGLIPRNKANALLFSNAAIIAAPGSALQISTLFYPRDLSKSTTVV